MTDEELAEIVARAEKATPGPWKALGVDVDGGDGSRYIGSFDKPEDTALAVAAVNAVPRLAAELRRAREALELLRAYFPAPANISGDPQLQAALMKADLALEEPSDG